MKQGITVAFAGILLTACNQTPSPDPSPQASQTVAATRDRCATDFIVITAAAPACGIALGVDGSLTAGDHRYPPVIASYQQGADGEVAIPARKLILFPAAPQSGRRIIQASENDAADSLCWAVRLAKPTSGVLQNVVAGKYGPEQWLSWSPNERHVALFSQSEGAQWLYIVDTSTGSTLTYPDASENADWQIGRESFAWTGDAAFSVKLKSCETCAFETRSFTLP